MSNDNSFDKPFDPLKDYSAEIQDNDLNIGGDNFFKGALQRYLEKEGQWDDNSFTDNTNSNELTWPLENIPDDGMAQDFIERAVDGIIHSYHDWWEENKEFKGIYVDPENLLEHFRLDRFDSDDYSRTVTFSLTPDPIFHDDKFEAYGLKLNKSNNNDAISSRVRLYGHDMLPDHRLDDRGFIFPALKEMAMPDYRYNRQDCWLFETIGRTEEVFWHNAFLQSIIYHQARGASASKPIEAFLRVARPNQLPSEEGFVKTLDKIKLVEGLE